MSEELMQFVIVSDRAPKGEIISGQVPTQDQISIESVGYKHVNVEWKFSKVDKSKHET